MSKRNNWSRWTFLFSIGAAAAFGCKSEPPAEVQDAPSTESKKALWTEEFQKKSILIAREISIEGPPGLIDHVAYKQVPEQRYRAQTIAEGFLQEIAVGEDKANPIWIQLDNLAINAVERARVLERVTEGPVRIKARGDAYWKNLETGQEQRAETIELVGPRAK